MFNRVKLNLINLYFQTLLYFKNKNKMSKVSKNLFKRLYVGIKKGLLTPTLPENIIKFKSNPLIKMARER